MILGLARVAKCDETLPGNPIILNLERIMSLEIGTRWYKGNLITLKFLSA